jgi:hypothetical protein
MPRKAVVHEGEYKVADGTVRISVSVGERQLGTSIVYLEDEPIANGDIEELPLGKGPALEGRTAEIYTMVTDVRSDSDEMSVTWILTGGSKKLAVTRSGSPPKEFGSQMFKGVFRFTTGNKKSDG